MTAAEMKEFEINKDKFHKNNKVDPKTGKPVRVGDFKPYNALIALYGNPDEVKTKKTSKKDKSEDEIKTNKTSKKDKSEDEVKTKKTSKKDTSEDEVKTKKTSKKDKSEDEVKTKKTSKKDKSEDEEFKINQAKFFEDNTVDPKTNKPVRVGNFKPYNALIQIYGEPPKDKAKTIKSTKKLKPDVSEEHKEEVSDTEKLSKKERKLAREVKRQAKKDKKQAEKDAEKEDADNVDDEDKKDEVSNSIEKEDQVVKEVKTVKSTKVNKVVVKDKEDEVVKEVKTIKSTKINKPVKEDEADVSVDVSEKKLIIKNDNTLPEDNKSWVMKFKHEGLPIIGNNNKKCDEWQADYDKMNELKEEAMKLIKVNLATSEGINCTYKCNYNKTHLAFFPKHIRPKNEGEVHIHTEINNKAFINNKWHITYYETFAPDDSTVDNTDIDLNDVLYIIISILHYNLNHSNDIQITNDKDLTLNRKYINQPKNKNIYPLYITYKALDM
jgi:hypothetical protein